MWQGWGASYEVRFRQPNIMSVAVKHSTLFTFVVDHAGNIRGSGVIIYDLDPNLCGLANLVKYTNSGINIVAALPGIMNLAKTLSEGYALIGKAVAAGESAAMNPAAEEEAADELKDLSKETADYLYDAIKDVLKDKLKDAAKEMVEKMGEEDKDEDAKKEAAGCGSVGPGNLRGALAKGASSAITGTPMIAGVTQVQYHYKGFENGPESRTFDIEGHVGVQDGQTKMFLELKGDVAGGPKDLTVVYQVNYKTDKGKFPAWSPFLDGPGIVTIGPSAGQAASDDVRQLADKLGQSLPDANPGVSVYFEEQGTHRNHVKAWNEYEYMWSARKIEPPAKP